MATNQEQLTLQHLAATSTHAARTARHTAALKPMLIAVVVLLSLQLIATMAGAYGIWTGVRQVAKMRGDRDWITLFKMAQDAAQWRETEASKAERRKL